MMLLTIILMLSVANGDTHPSGHFQYYLEDETPEETPLQDLRGTDTCPTARSPSPKLPMLFSMGAGPQWWSPERPYTKRRQNVAYYNLNSFGLCYGKSEQNMLAGFKQKIPVNVLAGNNNKNAGSTSCEYLHPLMYAIICFLAAIVVILLILLIKMFMSMQSAMKRDTSHTTSDTRESTALCQNNALSVSPTSGNGADNSSSTSSEGSLSDISTTSQRYVSLEDRRKTSDYINVSETASIGLVDLKKMDTDYVNVQESQQKKAKRKGHLSGDDGTTSFSSDDSTLNYSKVVFTKTEK